MKKPCLEVRDLAVQYDARAGTIDAVNGVSLTLGEGERVGIAGESGSGKTTLAHALLRVVESPGRITRGEILLEGTDLLKLSDEEMRTRRLARIALVPQGAMNSLNPVMRIGDQIALAMRDHDEAGPKAVSSGQRRRPDRAASSGQRRRPDRAASSGQRRRPDRAATRERVAELLESVRLERHLARRFPHELSGGMRQRVCVAMAISLGPKVIVADEPTSALDVVVQREVMRTLGSVQERLGASVLLIGHDMGVMAQFVDRIGIMYGGRLVEIGGVEEVFADPLHPYTRMLMSSIPTFERRGELRSVPGMPVSPIDPPPGCLFHPRCTEVTDRCRSEVPRAVEVSPGPRRPDNDVDPTGPRRPDNDVDPTGPRRPDNDVDPTGRRVECFLY